MAKRREFNVFTLSFLDVMFCGFGSVILIFIIINHSTETTSQEINAQLLAEVKKIELQVENETLNLVELRNTLEEAEDEIITTEALVLEIILAIKELQAKIQELADSGASQKDNIEALKSELKLLEEEAASLEGSVAGAESSGSSLRNIVGQGDRQYLTGLKIGGQHILILLDASASMLDKTIVNVIIRRNLPDEIKLQSEKWQRAIRTVEWIIANMPSDANFQLFTFNTETRPAIENTENEWLRVIEKADIDEALANLKKIIPSGGTSLHHPFAVARNMEPQPDNIFLIIDSLPTQGFEQPKRSAIESRDRVALFSSALEELPDASPINIILFPMEGDPIAAPSYWRLAQITGGSFLAPPDDWP
ncbi:MAG: VWA domain-containing protein [Proteobacteria bacterium]|nr:VWA domain-containing protein [Pseudomonadota bacterium]